MKKYFLLLSSVLILGIGCATQAPTIPVKDPEPVDVQKQPAIIDPLEAVYKFCENNGNNIVLQFDEPTKVSRAFCVFSNNTQCDAIEYMKGNCGPQNGAKIFANTGNDVTALLRTCTSEDLVVCGSDGRNYANRCVAELQHIVVKHENICTKEEQTETILTEETNTVTIKNTPAFSGDTPTTSGPASPSTVVSEQGDWLTLLYQMILTRGKQTPRAFVEECKADGEIMYYYQDGCADCFSVLYDKEGQIACFPNNDITENCPKFIKEKRGSVCKQIWKDAR